MYTQKLIISITIAIVLFHVACHKEPMFGNNVLGVKKPDPVVNCWDKDRLQTDLSIHIPKGVYGSVDITFFIDSTGCWGLNAIQSNQMWALWFCF